MLVTLYTSRVILNTLGVENYGIYNVVGGVVAMFSFFNSSMSVATQRFLSYELGKGNLIELKKIFNATQIIHIVLSILIFLLAETIGLWFINNYLVIPAERMSAAVWVYHFSVMSFMVSIIQVPYNATIIAHERMSVYAYVSIFEVTLKLLIVFMLSWLSFDKLKLYGILHFVVVFIIAAIYIVYTRINFKESKFEVVKDKNLFKTLISYSGWNLFGAMAGVSQGQGINILLNIFFGPVANAARGIATQVQAAVQSFVSNFQMAVNPQIVKSYAAGEKNYMTLLIIRSSKFSFYLLFLISFPIILEVDEILKLWLKTVPDYASIFTVLVLIVILIDCMSGPLMTAVQATGNIKIYQVILGSLQIIILPISYIFLKKGFAPEVTLYVNIVISIFALFFRLYFLKKLIDFPVRFFLNEVILKNAFIVVLSMIPLLLFRLLIDARYVSFFIHIILSIVWSGTLIYLIGLSRSEKKFILQLVGKIIHR